MSTHNHTSPIAESADAVIIGGGTAGLSAALMLGRSRRRTAVIDAGEPRNRFANHMHAVLGHDGTPPLDLLARARDDLAGYGVEFLNGYVRDTTDAGTHLDLTIDLPDGSTRTLSARAALLATGGTDRLPSIPGLAERWGVTVLHCPYCHGWEVQDQRLGVMVTAPPHAHVALLLRQLSASVTVFAAAPDALGPHDRSVFAARGITVVDSPVAAIHGPGTAISSIETEAGDHVEIDALFAGAPVDPQDGMVASLNLDREDGPMGNLLTVDAQGRTAHPRLWAAGNVVLPYANVPVSMGAGSMAGAHINATLAQEDATAAVAASDPRTFWDRRYSESERVWSGNANAPVVRIVSDLTPGMALDLGSGEGGDVLWLAEHGWDATGVELSGVAVERATAASARAGLSDRTAFVHADLTTWEPHGTYDLVSASYLHSPVALDRLAILRRAAAAVSPGGHLLLVTHASMPAWATEEPHTPLLTPEEELDALDLDSDWTPVRVETVPREVNHPERGTVSIDDGVTLLRRTP